MKPGEYYHALRANETGLPPGTGKDYSFADLAKKFRLSRIDTIIAARNNHITDESITAFWNSGLRKKEIPLSPTPGMIFMLGQDIMRVRLGTDDVYWPSQAIHFHSPPISLNGFDKPEVLRTWGNTTTPEDPFTQFTLRFSVGRSLFTRNGEFRERLSEGQLCIQAKGEQLLSGEPYNEHLHINMTNGPQQKEPEYKIGVPVEMPVRSRLYDVNTPDLSVFRGMFDPIFTRTSLHELPLTPDQCMLFARRLWNAHIVTP